MDSFEAIISPKALSAIYHQLQDYENTFADELNQ